jgi:glutathione reductase (NADPH)
MALRGVKFHFEESPVSIERDNGGQLSLKTNKGSNHSFSHIMFATGRRPNTKVYNIP